MPRSLTPSLWIALLGLATGCGTPSLYRWGEYEDLLYQRWNSTHEFSPQAQWDELEKESHEIASDGRRPHPGFHAYRGQLLLELGRESEAGAEFSREAQLYPESATFMKRFTARRESRGRR